MNLRKKLTLLACIGACVFSVTIPLVSEATVAKNPLPEITEQTNTDVTASVEESSSSDALKIPDTDIAETTDTEVLPDTTKLAVYVAEENETVTMSLEDYIVCVVAAEMPYTFHTEALKAQAVAARSYCLNKMLSGSSHEDDADVCTDYSHCAAYISEEELTEKYGKSTAESVLTKIRNAVKETEGEIITWQGKPALAVFHSRSYGCTESSKNIWGGSVPYLVSVSTPESDSISTVILSDDEISKLFSSPSAIKLNTSVTQNTLFSYFTDSGRQDYLCYGNSAVKAKLLRSLYGFRSLNFEYEKTADGWIFTVHGYGHGVGMSQYGANEMAKNGSTYDEILKHYYTGVTLETYGK